MERYIGRITEETWPEARGILDAFRAAYRTEGTEGWCNVWVDTEDLAGEPWWEELLKAEHDGGIVWQGGGQDHGASTL